MGCAIETLPCDACGCEVERFNIYIIKDKDGQQQFVCPKCSGQEETKKPEQ